MPRSLCGERVMTSKILVATCLPVAFASVAFACSDSSARDPNAGDPNAADPNAADPNTADAASAPDAEQAGTGADARGSDARSPAKPDGSDGLDQKGGIKCKTRCEKAGCPDLEACEALCAKEAAAVPAACQPTFHALETCADTNGNWKCVDGEAKTSSCMDEAFATLDCVLGVALDGGADSGADGGS